MYPAEGGRNRPHPKYITARSDPRRPELKRYILVEGELTGQRTQPYTHCVEVTIRNNGKIYHFIVFFKRHVSLPVNTSTRELAEAGIRGDVLVVACGPRVGARGIGRRETAVADKVVRE